MVPYSRSFGSGFCFCYTMMNGTKFFSWKTIRVLVNISLSCRWYGVCKAFNPICTGKHCLESLKILIKICAKKKKKICAFLPARTNSNKS